MNDHCQIQFVHKWQMLAAFFALFTSSNGDLENTGLHVFQSTFQCQNKEYGH